MDLAYLTHGNDLFECNLCGFESGMGDSIREHLIDHVNSTLEEEPTGKDVKSVQSEAKSLLDEYDDDGNYIGDNPKYMDKHDTTESESEEDQQRLAVTFKKMEKIYLKEHKIEHWSNVDCTAPSQRGRGVARFG